MCRSVSKKSSDEIVIIICVCIFFPLFKFHTREDSFDITTHQTIRRHPVQCVRAVSYCPLLCALSRGRKPRVAIQPGLTKTRQSATLIKLGIIKHLNKHKSLTDIEDWESVYMYCEKGTLRYPRAQYFEIKSTKLEHFQIDYLECFFFLNMFMHNFCMVIQVHKIQEFKKTQVGNAKLTNSRKEFIYKLIQVNISTV